MDVGAGCFIECQQDSHKCPKTLGKPFFQEWTCWNFSLLENNCDVLHAPECNQTMQYMALQCAFSAISLYLQIFCKHDYFVCMTFYPVCNQNSSVQGSGTAVKAWAYWDTFLVCCNTHYSALNHDDWIRQSRGFRNGSRSGTFFPLLLLFRIPVIVAA